MGLLATAFPGGSDFTTIANPTGKACSSAKNLSRAERKSGEAITHTGISGQTPADKSADSTICIEIAHCAQPMGFSSKTVAQIATARTVYRFTGIFDRTFQC